MIPTRLPPSFVFRDDVVHTDERAVRRMALATGFFRADEVDVACELVRERRERGAASGYEFVLADDPSGRLAGYAAFGLIPCTQASFDLYWIIVDPTLQRAGLGRELVSRVEQRVRVLGGRSVYIETSSLEKYQPTHRFYERCGYSHEATLADFYQLGDDKLVFSKRLGAGR